MALGTSSFGTILQTASSENNYTNAVSNVENYSPVIGADSSTVETAGSVAWGGFDVCECLPGRMRLILQDLNRLSHKPVSPAAGTGGLDFLRTYAWLSGLPFLRFSGRNLRLRLRLVEKRDVF